MFNLFKNKQLSTTDITASIELAQITNDLRECNSSQLQAMLSLMELHRENDLNGNVIINDYVLSFNNGKLTKVFDIARGECI